MNKKGFTLIELLVVVAIIGILATVVITTVSSARNKTQATKIATQLKEIEKGLFAATLEENRETYWTNTELGIATAYGNFAPFFTIEYPNPGWAIKNYLTSGTTSIPGSLLRYRASGSEGVCGRGESGVSIRIDYLSLEQRLDINKILDGEESTTNSTSSGGVECGKFSPRIHNTGSSYGIYRLSRNIQTIDF